MTKVEAEKLLAEYLQHNTHSAIVEQDTPVGKQVVVRAPWNDETVAIVVEAGDDPSIDALNHVYLPERFTALWHRDSKDFECIYTAFPLTGARADLKDRAFEFRYEGKKYKCEFGRSSDRLLAIAKAAIPVAPQTETGFRNLQSFGLHVRGAGPVHMKGAVPYSFWVRNIEWNEDDMLSFALHLNFYLTYYDSRSPRIVINPVKADKQSSQPRTRYTTGQFPQSISAKTMDDELLLFWLAAQEGGNSGQRFTYCYRILEYVCHTYIEATLRAKMRQLLEAPDALDTVPRVVEQSVVTLLGYLKDREDHARIEAYLREVLDPKLLWREVQANIGSFKKDTSFVGGEVIKALPAECLTEDGFSKSGVREFCDRARRIRNALSHGREHRQMTFIAPTASNFELLSPWATLLMVAAGEAIIRRGSL